MKRVKRHPRVQPRPRRAAPRRSAVSALEDHLGYWLRFVSNHVSHAFRAKVERHGVTVAEWVVMRALLSEEGMMPSEISGRIGLTRGAVSKLVDRLANKHLVAIHGHAADKRAQVISLTDQGARLVPQLAALADDNDAETFGHLSGKERAAMVTLLKGIVERLGLKAAPVE